MHIVDQIFVLIISFIIFFLPSFIVFIYKISFRKKTGKSKNFWAFLYSEYISIFLITGIMLITVLGVKLVDKYKSSEKISNPIAHAEKFEDHKTLEKIYTNKLVSDSLNLYFIHQKIFYHCKEDKIKYSYDGSVVGKRYDKAIRDFFISYDLSNDSLKHDIWPYYLFLTHYFDGNYDLAIADFSNNNIAHLKYTNYYMGSYHWNDWKITERYYLKEIENKGFIKKSHQALAKLYLANNEIAKAEQLIHGEATQAFISKSIKAQWAFQTHQYMLFLSLKYQMAYERITLSGFLIALIILAMWFLFFYRLDLFEKEKIQLLIFTVLLSALITNLCLLAYAYYDTHLLFGLNGNPLNDLLYSIFGIGLIEETTKLIPFLIVFFLFRKEFNEPFDYILFMVMSALGFAFEENMMYFEEGTTHTFSARAIYSSMGHMFFSATIAYGIILSIYRYSKWYRIPIVIVFFLLSITAHGVYDYLLFYNHHYIFLFFFLLITKLFIQYINNALNNSSYFDYKVNMQTINLRQIIAIGISLVFAAEYIYTAWYYSVPKANDLALDLYKYSCFFVMIYLADHFSHFNLVKGQWGVFKIDFNSFNMHKEEENFIGKRVIISRAGKVKQEMDIFHHLPDRAKIIDRTSIKYESIWLKKRDILENDWFLLELETPLKTSNGVKSHILINFTSKAVSLFHKKEAAIAMMMKDEMNLENINPKSHFILLGKIYVENND